LDPDKNPPPIIPIKPPKKSRNPGKRFGWPWREGYDPGNAPGGLRIPGSNQPEPFRHGPGKGFKGLTEESLGVRQQSAPRIGRVGNGIVSFVASPIAQGFNVLLARPQKYVRGALDFRGWLDPDRESMDRMNEETPVSGQIVAVMAQGSESIGDPVDGASKGIPYTTKPRQGRYLGGTVSGGFWVVPPEVGMEHSEDSFAPKGVTRSTTLFGVVPGAYFAAGNPNFSNGGVFSGYRWGVNSSGDLVFSRFNSSGANVFDMTFPTADGGAGDVLTTDGSGNLSFGPAGGGGVSTLYSTAVPASTTGTAAPEVLQTYTIPGATAATDGDAIVVRAWGAVASNTNPKTITLLWGGVFPIITNDIVLTPNGQAWVAEAKIVRRSAVLGSASATMMSGAVPQSATDQQLNSVWANPITVALYGTDNGTAADITCDGIEVELAPA
jgi:hypothetical protein